MGSFSTGRSWDEADFNKDAVDKESDWSPELELSNPEFWQASSSQLVTNKIQRQVAWPWGPRRTPKGPLGCGKAEPPTPVDPALPTPLCSADQCFHSIQIDLLSTPPGS